MPTEQEIREALRLALAEKERPPCSARGLLFSHIAASGVATARPPPRSGTKVP